MPILGTMKCTRCMLAECHKEAAEKKHVITMRKSVYGTAKDKRGQMRIVVGTKLKEPGVDIYIHPRHVEIPSNYQYWHNLEPAGQEFLAAVLNDDDPEKWWEAWFPKIPSKCMCRQAGGEKKILRVKQ